LFATLGGVILNAAGQKGGLFPKRRGIPLKFYLRWTLSGSGYYNRLESLTLGKRTSASTFSSRVDQARGIMGEIEYGVLLARDLSGAARISAADLNNTVRASKIEARRCLFCTASWL